MILEDFETWSRVKLALSIKTQKTFAEAWIFL